MSSTDKAGDVSDDTDNVSCIRDIEIDDDVTLHIAEQHASEDEAGACIWDAALVLCNFLIKQQELGRKLVAGKRVIDLGSGTGAVGLTAAALGASKVVLTDREHNIPHISNNIKRNKLSSSAVALPLDWTQPLPEQLQPPYDVVLASDIVYTKDMVPHILATLQALSGPDTVMYISSEYRKGAGLEQFHEIAAKKYKFYAQLVPYTELHEDWCSPDILLWQITTRPLQGSKEQSQQR